MTVQFLDDYIYQDSARRMLCFEEGVRERPYRDTKGFLTIGAGRNLDAVPLNEEEIRVLLDNDIMRAVKAARAIYGKIFFDTLICTQQLALINLAFNLGEVGLSKFIETNALIKEQKWAEAADRLLTKTLYATQVPKRAERIATMLREEVFPYS